MFTEHCGYHFFPDCDLQINTIRLDQPSHAGHETPLDSESGPVMLIKPTGLHWLGPDSHQDLCAHGGVELIVNGDPFVVSEEADLAVSTGALHLLRTVRADHTAETPVAEHLIPHCGHFMYRDAASGRVVNVGCPSGLDWWVRHEGEAAALVRHDGYVRRVPWRDWILAVAGFADAVDAFYAASPARVPGDAHDADWFEALRAEWAELRSTLPSSGSI